MGLVKHETFIDWDPACRTTPLPWLRLTCSKTRSGGGFASWDWSWFYTTGPEALMSVFHCKQRAQVQDSAADMCACMTAVCYAPIILCINAAMHFSLFLLWNTDELELPWIHLLTEHGKAIFSSIFCG